MNSRGAFEQWYENSPWHWCYKGILESGWDAACQYKDEQCETERERLTRLNESLWNTHKKFLESEEQIESENESLKARIAELEEDRKIMIRSHNKLSEVNRELGLESKKCQGLPDARCKYLATCGSPCNKCGRVHNPLSFEIYPTGDE